MLVMATCRACDLRRDGFQACGRHARLYNEMLNLVVVAAPVPGAKNWTNVCNLRATQPFWISGRHARLYNGMLNLDVVGAPVSGAIGTIVDS